MRMPNISIAAALAAAACTSVAAAAADYPVAGLAPNQRPVGAPVIKEFVQTPQWRAAALRGVSKPYPSSLKFLDDQGAWYTPFDRPGTPDPYDPRGMHKPADSPTTKR